MIHEPSEKPTTRWVTMVRYNQLDHLYALATNRIAELEAELRKTVLGYETENKKLRETLEAIAARQKGIPHTGADNTASWVWGQLQTVVDIAKAALEMEK